MDRVREFWETCGENYAHLVDKGFLRKTKFQKRITNYFLNRIHWENKTVLEYGVGGGYLAHLLFTKKHIRRYYGIDIAQRSINKARETLRVHKRVDFFMPPQDFRRFNADIFISMATIQHFPSWKYLLEFWNNLNQSLIKHLVLQIRVGGKTKFNDAYNSNGDIGLACIIKPYDQDHALSRYRRIYISPVEPTRYQFFIYERIR